MAEFNGFDAGNTCWVDLTTNDVDSAVHFYSSLFGWQATESVATSSSSSTAFTLNGKQVAALSRTSDADSEVAWHTYIATDNADDTVTAARNAGGRVEVEPTSLRDAGRFAVIRDTAGASVRIWESGTFKGVESANDYDTWGYSELLTPDPQTAIPFYQTVFGWSPVSNEEMGMQGHSWFLGDKHLGGIMDTTKDEGYEGFNGWLNYFGTENLDTALETATKLGATVLRPSVESAIGWWATVQDPQGALLGVAQMKVG